MTKKNPKKPLALSPQTLRPLDGAQLDAAAGGYAYPTVRRIYSCSLGCLQ